MWCIIQESPHNYKVVGSTEVDGYTRSGGTQFHNGIDIAASYNSAIYPMYGGRVVSVGYHDRLGYFVTVQSLVNGHYYIHTYSHLQNENRPLNGSQIQAGTPVGFQGVSGNLERAIDRGYTAHHTHVMVRKRTGSGWNLERDFSPVNPEEIMRTKFDANGNPTNPRNCN